MASTDRPLSPFLHYRPQITSVLSFGHRLSGIMLSLGAAVMVLWLAALAEGPAGLASMAWLGGITGKLFLGAWTLAFFYHLNNGIRHLFWDAGLGFKMPTVVRSGWTVVIASILMWVAFWFAMSRAMVGS